jgi:aconitate hydratase
VSANLTAFLFETHGAGWPGPGQPVSVSPDHVVLDEEGGVVALLAFEALGATRTPCPVALVCPAREAAGPDELDDQRFLRTAAAAYGLWFARPGAAPAAALHRRRFAVPGGLLASPAPGAAGAGAYGMLALVATPLECAAALVGQALVRPRPRVIGVRLTSALPPGAGGVEALERLASALGREARGAVLQYHGEGLASLSMADRIAMAALAPRRLAVAASVFPSDEATRDHLAACGRDAEWRRFEGGVESFDTDAELDLSLVSPVREAGTVFARIGPLAGDGDLRSLADGLGDGVLSAETRVQVVVGGRAARAALESDGTLERLSRAGVAVLAPGDGEAGVPLPAGAVAFGDEDALDAGATSVSIAALVARLAPAPAPAARTVAAPDSATLDPAELLAPAESPGAVVERGAAHRVPAPLPPLTGGLRGVVLLRVRGRVGCEQLLPWGPRTRALRGDALALAQQWGRGLDPEAAARGLAHGGGFAVADAEYGLGEPAEDAARATAALGVRAVIAGSFPSAHERALVMCGVVPLRWTRAGDADNLEAGDELELPMLAEVLAAGRRVTVRHLTRGLSFTVMHDLDERSLDLVRAGGLLGLALEPERT